MMKDTMRMSGEEANMKRRKGFTLLELLVSVVILVLVLVVLLQLYLYWFNLSETAASFFYAASQTQEKLEEIRNRSFYDFDSIVVDYGSGGSPGNIFNLQQGNATGVIYVNNTNPELLEIEIVTSLLANTGRVVGEDADLDGILDAGEDANGNGKFDSPVTLKSFLTKR